MVIDLPAEQLRRVSEGNPKGQPSDYDTGKFECIVGGFKEIKAPIFTGIKLDLKGVKMAIPQKSPPPAPKPLVPTCYASYSQSLVAAAAAAQAEKAKKAEREKAREAASKTYYAGLAATLARRNLIEDASDSSDAVPSASTATGLPYITSPEKVPSRSFHLPRTSLRFSRSYEPSPTKATADSPSASCYEKHPNVVGDGSHLSDRDQEALYRQQEVNQRQPELSAACVSSSSADSSLHLPQTDPLLGIVGEVMSPPPSLIRRSHPSKAGSVASNVMKRILDRQQAAPPKQTLQQESNHSHHGGGGPSSEVTTPKGSRTLVAGGHSLSSSCPSAGPLYLMSPPLMVQTRGRGAHRGGQGFSPALMNGKTDRVLEMKFKI